MYTGFLHLYIIWVSKGKYILKMKTKEGKKWKK